MYFCGKKYWSKFYRFQRSKPVPPRLAGIEVKNAAPKMPVVPPGNLCIHILSLWHYFNIFIYIISIYKIYIYICMFSNTFKSGSLCILHICLYHTLKYPSFPTCSLTDWLADFRHCDWHPGDTRGSSSKCTQAISVQADSSCTCCSSETGDPGSGLGKLLGVCTLYGSLHVFFSIPANSLP